MTKVSIISHGDYEPAPLDHAIRRSVELCGFDLRTARGRRVLLKPNLLGAFPPSKGVTTHPAFVEAAARIFQGEGAHVSIGDSPNGIFGPDRCWEISGLKNACRICGADEIHFEAMGSRCEDGIMLSKAALDADIIVNLPKFKTHGLTVLTLAVKNLFGCVCGMTKSRYHRENPDRQKFAELLVKIADRVKPALSIIDGIVAMEGEGPSAGKLTDLGAIIAGTDCHAVDAACCRLVGLQPSEMDTLAAAKAIGSWDESAPIDIVGDFPGRLPVQRFLLPSTYRKGSRDWWLARFIIARIWSNVSSQPSIDRKSCVKCLLCQKACPVDAISVKSEGDFPLIDEAKCIQCLCCHEICQSHAIRIKPSMLVRIGRIMTRLRTLGRTR